MKREEKKALSKARIIEAAMHEFSTKGYRGASLNTVCSEYDISKGIIYHYFKDKDELYLICVKNCFEALTNYLNQILKNFSGTLDQKLEVYFDSRNRFLAENPLCFGIYADVIFSPPPSLYDQIEKCRKEFDELNISVLTDFLRNQSIRKELSIPEIVEDFRIYMDYFNMRLKKTYQGKTITKDMLEKHEERCHRQLDIFLHGVCGEKNEN